MRVPRQLRNQILLDDADIDSLADVVSFLFNNCTEEDEQALRAMLVWGATSDQVSAALAISAANHRVVREDKLKYAFGVVKNLMLEQKP